MSRSGLRRSRSGSSSVDRRAWLALDGLLGLLVLAGTLVGINNQQRWTVVGPEPGLGLLIFVAAAAAVMARTFPVPALVVASVLDAVPHWLPIGGAGHQLAFMICLYMVVAHCPRRTATVSVAVVLVVQVVLMAGDLNWMWGHAFVMVEALAVVLATALGAATRARQAAVLALQARAEEAERSRDAEARKLLAEERLRVARDLHDSVAHHVAVMNLNTAVASNALPDRPEDATRALVTVREAGRSVIASIGDLLRGLRDDNRDDMEQRYDVDEVRVLVGEFRTLMPLLNLKLSGEVTPGGGVGAVTYLVLQESLTNAYKHGDHDAPVEVELERGRDTYCLRVTNRSRHARSEFVEGFGLRGMRERVAAGGGRLDISCTDRTFVVCAELPDRAGVA